MTDPMRSMRTLLSGDRSRWEAKARHDNSPHHSAQLAQQRDQHLAFPGIERRDRLFRDRKAAEFAEQATAYGRERTSGPHSVTPYPANSLTIPGSMDFAMLRSRDPSAPLRFVAMPRPKSDDAERGSFASASE